MNISVINPSTKKVEIVLKMIERGPGKDITDFRLFGEREDRVVSVTSSCQIILYSMSYKQKRGVVAHYQEDLMNKRNEQGQSIAVCKKNEYVCVGIGQWKSPSLCSRMIILKLNQNSFIKTASVDLFRKEIGANYVLETIGYVGRHIMWVGLSWKSGSVQVLDYDTETGGFNEIEDKRVSHEEFSPFKLRRLGDQLYYIGENGKLMRLGVTN